MRKCASLTQKLAEKHKMDAQQKGERVGFTVQFAVNETRTWTELCQKIAYKTGLTHKCSCKKQYCPVYSRWRLLSLEGMPLENAGNGISGPLHFNIF